jgi:tRNA(Met) cytidine acetyltransferase
LNTNPDVHTEIKAWLAAHLESAKQARHRYALVLSGDRSWSGNLAQTLFDSGLWVGEAQPEGFQHRHAGLAHTVLGQEFERVVLDAWSGLDADDLGALAGVIQAGGLLIILVPPLDSWPDYADPSIDKMRIAGVRDEDVGHRFLERLVKTILADQHILLVQKKQDQLEFSPVVPGAVNKPEGLNESGRTQDQVKAIKAIQRLMATAEPGAVALIANRGRGKSSALGMAASDLANTDYIRIVLTAPRFSAVSQVFEHFEPLAHDSEAVFEFVAPDALIRSPVEADLLIIDEAAAIPVQMLVSLLQHYPRVVFSTTVHGYEGSGRGFEIRFARLLDNLRPGWEKIIMHQPIRWADQDPLEAFAFRALLMNASPVNGQAVESAIAENCRYQQLDRDDLLNNDGLLSELFGLLVMAHYRTRPFDLRYLMDAPNVEIHTLSHDGHVLAVAMLSREGGFDRQISEAIYAGLRRPRGHLLAQSLSAHCGVERAPEYDYARIVRIAVHPELQGKGLGSRLLEELSSQIRSSGIVGIGTSFASDERVIRFWQRQGYWPVHVGVMQEHTTGSFPLLMFRPLDDTGEGILEEARQRFRLRLPLLHQGPLRSMQPELLSQLESTVVSAGATHPDTHHELLAFTYGYRGLELSLYVIREYLERPELDLDASLEPSQCNLVRFCILEGGSPEDAVAALGLSGKKEVVSRIRGILASLIEQEADPTMLKYQQHLLELQP